MLIWLGVVGTVLCLGVIAIIIAAMLLDSRMLKVCRALEDAGKTAEEFLENFKRERAEFIDGMDDSGVSHASELKAIFGQFTKSEQELADNLAALLREVKVSKAFALGSTALVEQNVAAVDKLWQMVEMLRRGPRVATNLAPSDEEIARREKGESSEQQVAIDGMLAAARDRLMHPDDLQ